MTQEQVHKSAKKTEEEIEELAVKEDADAKELLKHSDELLDEIDLLLEPNAAEFVAAYVQKGGQ